ncbi:MAG: hypothetical protein QOJ25_1473 [Solirubrobacteraceae bacterium]|jgi:hypothetical protein|nr:hypothetical protein [Solirubrobacteraceae bacterium]
MRALRKMTAGVLLCLAIAGCVAIAGCGGGNTKRPTGTATTSIAALVTPTTSTTTTADPATFATGYEQSWGIMKRVGVEILGAINEVKRASAKHQSVSNGHIASEFATFAAEMEPGVIGLGGLTPPASVRSAFRSMAVASVQLAATLRSFSTDAAASRGAQGQRDIAAYLAYAAVIDKDALTIYKKLGLK